MSKAGYIGVTAPSRPLFPTGSPDPSLHWVERDAAWGTSGQGFGSVRLFIHPYELQLCSFTRWVRGPVTGGGVVRMSFSSAFVRHYSHFFQNIADVAHQFASSVCVSVQNIGRDDFRYAQKDFAFGAKYE